MTDHESVQELEYLPLDSNKYWSSHDLGCAAALVSLGFDLMALNKENPQKVKFIFKSTEDIEEVIKEYWNRGLQVDAQTYFNSLKSIKNQIYSE
jgi:signal transduction protein with GAF and PtsI domain